MGVESVTPKEVPAETYSKLFDSLDTVDKEILTNIAGDSNNLTEAISKFKKYESIKHLRTEDDFAFKGELFHGSSSSVSSLSSGHYTETNIYGDGFYTTSKRNIADSYTKKGKGKEPSVYKVEEIAPSKTLDLEKAQALEVKDLFPKDLELKDGASIREAIDELRSQSKELKLPSYEVMETIDNIQNYYKALGYNSWSHKGGLATHSEGHYVRIYFNPETDIKLIKVN